MQGRTYLCKKLDLDSRVATVRPADLKYYTKVRDYCDVHVTGGRAYYQAAVCPWPFISVGRLFCHRLAALISWHGRHLCQPDATCSTTCNQRCNPGQ